MKRAIIYYVLIFGLFFLITNCGRKENVIEKRLFPVKAGNNWGFVDTTCSFFESPIYQGANDFFCERSLISKSGKISYLKPNGKEAMLFLYEKGTDFSENLAFVLDSLNIISCIDTSMKVQFIVKDAEEVHVFSEGLAAVRKNDKFGFINSSGKIIIPFNFDASLDFSEGICGVAKLMGTEDSTFYEWTFIDKTGKQVINSVFEEVHEFKMGLASVKSNGKFGWIDKSGKFVFGNDFDECKSFSEGFASYSKGGAWGLINRKGNIIMEPSFSSIGDVKEGMAMFSLGIGHSTGYVDTTGKIIIKPVFQSVSEFKKGYAYVAKNNRISLISKSGKINCDEQFESAPGFLGPDLGFINLSMNSRLEIIVDSVSAIINE